MAKKQKQDSIFIQEVKRDINTFRRLRGRERLQFVWDYFRWKILAAIVILLIVLTFARLLWEGQKPCRLRVCVVLNNEEFCDSWFDAFFNELKKDGKKGACDLNQDQPFDYDNIYYYVQELEVQTTVSSQRMDVAVCGPDMYEYLLSIKACLPLDTALPDQLKDSLTEKGMLKKDKAGVTINRDGSLNEEEAEEGFFAIDISNTAFGQKYNQNQKLEEGEEEAPLYAIIISNTEHLEDSLKLVEALCE